MTLIELFPWLTAACITLFSVRYLQHISYSSALSYGIGIGLGIISWLLIVFGGKYLVSKYCNTKKTSDERRNYIKYDPQKRYFGDKNHFFECQICGNIISSFSKRTMNCKCKNIVVDAALGQVNIQETDKIKLFYKQK